MTKSAQPYVVLIRRAVAQIDLYRPSDVAEFLAEPMAQDAILMRLQEIGENLARIRHLFATSMKKRLRRWRPIPGTS